MMALENLLTYYNKKQLYNKMDTIKTIQKSIVNLSRKEIDEKYIHNKNYKDYLSDYLNNLLNDLGYIKHNNEYEQRKEQLKNNLFFREIFNIDLNNINQVLYLLDSNLYNIDEFDNMDNVYNKHIKSYESLIEEANEDLTEELTTILKSDEFMDYLKEVLESAPVQNYLKNKRKFDSSNNKVKILNENENDFDDNLKAGYEKLMDYLKEKKDWLNDIIIIKYMSKKKEPSLTH